MNLGDYTWSCPRHGCKKFIMTYTEAGCRLLSEEHIDQHMREDREKTAKIEMTQAIQLHARPKDYDTLELTWQDIQFLRTRHVKIDDKIWYDPSIEPGRIMYEGMPLSKWAKILNRAWEK